MAAISQRTSTIRLGQMVGCNSYRNPGLLAKITATVDVISGGRLDWGIGAGWYENEYRSYGYDFPKPSDRLHMLEEAVQIVTSMWTQPETTFRGAHYEIVRAQCDPKPLQQPRPPVWIGGGGEQVTLRIVAKHADYSNFGGDLEQWAHKRDVLRRHCEAVGRDPDEIRMTWSPEVFIRSTEAEVEAGGTRSLWGEALASWRAGNLVGTPEQVGEKLRAYADLGVAGVIPWCSDYPDTETLTRLADRGDARVPLSDAALGHEAGVHVAARSEVDDDASGGVGRRRERGVDERRILRELLVGEGEQLLGREVDVVVDADQEHLVGLAGRAVVVHHERGRARRQRGGNAAEGVIGE